MSIPGQEEMPLTYFPSFLSPSLLLVSQRSAMCTGRFSRCSALFHLYILTILCVCHCRPLLPRQLLGPLGPGGAEPRNCLATQCKLCVYSGGRGHSGHPWLSPSHLLPMIKDVDAGRWLWRLHQISLKNILFLLYLQSSVLQFYFDLLRRKRNVCFFWQLAARYLLTIQHKSAVDL